MRVPKDKHRNFIVFSKDFPCSPQIGFERIDIEPTRVYDIGDARAFLSGRGINVEEFARALEGKFISAFVRASKPAAGCCASSGCK